MVDTPLANNNDGLIYFFIVICIYLSEYVPNPTDCSDLPDGKLVALGHHVWKEDLANSTLVNFSRSC